MNTEVMEGVASGEFGRTNDDANIKPIPFKICVVGNSDVGKTCIVERYVNNIFKCQANTLAAAFCQKTLTVQPKDSPESTKVKLQIWDTAGAEEYRSINQLYYKKAAIVCLVYSVTDYESFDALEYWQAELDQHADANCIRFVVGSKIDITDMEED